MPASAFSIMANALVSRPPASLAVPRMRRSSPRCSATATLRCEEENSSAKIFIGKASLEFVRWLDQDKAVVHIRRQVLSEREFGPSVDPFNDCYSRALKNI